jgi:hypothetical protein
MVIFKHLVLPRFGCKFMPKTRDMTPQKAKLENSTQAEKFTSFS